MKRLVFPYDAGGTRARRSTRGGAAVQGTHRAGPEGRSRKKRLTVFSVISRNAGAAAHPVKVDLIGERSNRRGRSGFTMPAIQAKACKASLPFRGEDPDFTSRPPTALDALFGCFRAAHVQIETAYGPLITRERMAVLCRGSND